MTSPLLAELLHAVPHALADPLTWGGLRFDGPALLVRAGLMAAWIVLAIVAAVAAPRRVARGAEIAGAKPWSAMFAGLLVHASLALAAVLAAGMTLVPLVGVPLLLLVVLAAAVIRAPGLAAAFSVVGARLLARSSGRSSAYAHLLLGALACGALAFVPVVGPIAWLLLASAGMGGVLAARRAPIAP